MSNFICSECGMTNIDCGGAGYKTPKEIELEKQIERLQEQINEANGVICGLYHLVIDKKAASGVVCDYLVKYGKPFDVKSGV